MTNTTKLALAAVLVLGTASIAQAGSKDDPDPVGGFSVGPAGQSLSGGGAAYGSAGGAFGSASAIKQDGKCWVNTANGNYSWAPCR
jgi:hypothetical protein